MRWGVIMKTFTKKILQKYSSFCKLYHLYIFQYNLNKILIMLIKENSKCLSIHTTPIHTERNKSMDTAKQLVRILRCRKITPIHGTTKYDICFIKC